MQRKARKETFPLFNSFFFQAMFDEKNTDPVKMGRYNYEKVRRWSSKVPGNDIFNLTYIICPVNLDNVHWTVAVIFMETKRIQWYDSEGGTDKKKLHGLLQYLKDEFKERMVETWLLMSGIWCPVRSLHLGSWMVSEVFHLSSCCFWLLFELNKFMSLFLRIINLWSLRLWCFHLYVQWLYLQGLRPCLHPAAYQPVSSKNRPIYSE